MSIYQIKNGGLTTENVGSKLSKERAIEIIGTSVAQRQLYGGEYVLFADDETLEIEAKAVEAEGIAADVEKFAQSVVDSVLSKRKTAKAEKQKKIASMLKSGDFDALAELIA